MIIIFPHKVVQTGVFGVTLQRFGQDRQSFAVFSLVEGGGGSLFIFIDERVLFVVSFCLFRAGWQQEHDFE